MVSVQSNRGGHAAFMEGAPMLDATTFIGLDVHARSLVRGVGRPDALRALQRGERPQGRDHQGRQQAPEEGSGRGRVALPDVLRSAEGPRQGPGPGPGRPQACRQGRAEAGREAGGAARARGPQQQGERGHGARARLLGVGGRPHGRGGVGGRPPAHKPITPEAVRSEAVEANLRSLFCERPGRHTRAQTVGST